MKNHIEEKILKVLSKNRDGVTIADISRHIGVHRNTVSKYIFGLVKEGTVNQRRIGVVSLCYLSTSTKPVKEKEFLEKLKRKIK